MEIINHGDVPSKQVANINKNFEELSGGGAGEMNVKPIFTASGNLPEVTVAGGTAWTTLPAQELAQLTIYNDTGFVLEMQQDGSGGIALVFVDRETPFFGITNANQVALRRRDKAADPLVVHARWES